MTLYIQGIAAHMGKVFHDGNEFLYFKAGCFSGSENNVGLCYDHEGKIFAHDRLEVHFGDDSVAFRYEIPKSWAEQFHDVCDEIETYVPVSLGLTITKSKLVKIDGETVKVIVAADLKEISVLTKSDPAIKSTYGRIVSSDTIGELSEDVEAGRLDLVGRVISLHRKVKAADNGGVVSYANSLTDYERAGNRFTSALMRLA